MHTCQVLESSCDLHVCVIGIKQMVEALTQCTVLPLGLKILLLLCSAWFVTEQHKTMHKAWKIRWGRGSDVIITRAAGCAALVHA